MKNILHLHLKKKWYDMIASGEKKEEYRDFKPYYHKRLYHPYEYVKLHLGYTKTHMLFRCIKIDVGFGKEEWGAEKDKLYYVIYLGEKIMITENQFKKWFYSLSTEENRRAKREILEKFDMSASTFYYWLGDNFHFSKLKRDALNAFAKEFNNSVIFVEPEKKEIKL